MEYEKIINLINENKFSRLNYKDENTKKIINILYNKKIINKKFKKVIKLKDYQLVIGNLCVNENFGFLETKDEKFYVKNIFHYFDDDLVIGMILPKKRGEKRSAIILSVLEQNKEYLVFKINQNNRIFPLESKYQKYFFKILGTKEKNKFIKVKIIERSNKKILCQVIEAYEPKENETNHVYHILAKNNIKKEFSKKTRKTVERILNIDYGFIKRKDLQNLDFVTIDDISAKDLDDAIYLEKNEKTYRLIVSIADVSNFVHPNTPIDQDAYNRGCSIYYLDTVIQMLPEKLSNDICSLQPNKKRYTLSCEMEIDFLGNVIKKEVYPSIIQSKAKLSYQEVNLLFENKCCNKFEKMLFEMRELHHILKNKRLNEGSIEFERDELKFIFDENHNIIEMKQYIRQDAECLIEEFMLLANISVTEIVNNLKKDFIYRVHEKIDDNDLFEIAQEIKKYGIKLDKEVSCKNILDSIDDDFIYKIISKKILKKLPKAKYSSLNIGHFGLAFDNYTHFTSPIRRYPDLVVHRLLKTYLFDDKKELNFDLEDIANQASKKEIQAVNIEREILELQKSEYAKNLIGQQFMGRIVKIFENAMIIELDNTLYGKIFLEDYQDYLYTKDEIIHFKTKTLTLMDGLFVKLVDVDSEKGKLKFDLVNFKKKEKMKRGKYVGYR